MDLERQDEVGDPADGTNLVDSRERMGISMGLVGISMAVGSEVVGGGVVYPEDLRLLKI